MKSYADSPQIQDVIRIGVVLDKIYGFDEKAENITRQYNLPEKIKAPVEEGQVLGSVDYYLNGNKIGSVELKACKKVSKASYIDYFKKICYKYIIIEN